MVRSASTAALAVALLAAPAGPHGDAIVVLAIPAGPLGGAITHVSFVGPAPGDEIVHTTWNLTYVAPHGGTPASEVVLQLTIPLTIGPAEMVLTGADLGWPAAAGSFTAVVDSDALDGQIEMGDSAFSAPELTISSTQGGVTGEFVDSKILLKLAACQKDLGFGGPGTVELQVCGDPLVTGGIATLSVAGAPAFAPMLVTAGITFGPIPFKGGTLVPIPRLLGVFVWAGATGDLAVDIPGGHGPMTLYLQVVVADPAQVAGIAISNALQLEFLP